MNTFYKEQYGSRKVDYSVMFSIRTAPRALGPFHWFRVLMSQWLCALILAVGTTGLLQKMAFGFLALLCPYNINKKFMPLGTTSSQD